MRHLTVFFSLLLLAAQLKAEQTDFSHQIVPILREKCGDCHSGNQKEGAFSINTRQSTLAGGESGAAITVGESKSSELVLRVTSTDDSVRMPPEGEPLTQEQVALIAKWIDEGAHWEPGFSFGEPMYEPPLKPRMPDLPVAVDGRNHPIDRILDNFLKIEERAFPAELDDETFLRRAFLDLIGLLPTPEERDAFLRNTAPDRRDQLVRSLLARDIDYAEHWLSFWNDLLRNDYAGTGFITKGRTQISEWLYDALVANKPYDKFCRELVAPPTADSAGFANGIRWRGEVSAGQTVEIQFAQSVGQAFLGINLKCASCHDSFIDRWTLDDAFGLAAIYSQQPLELHRCDKPLGKMATPAWIFGELGNVDPEAPQPERLMQLADLLTHRDNGRFTRTIVNRLWHRMMGRGIVHPTDAMQTEPWNADLIDFLAEDFANNGYDLKKTLALIASSRAYQSKAERVTEHTDDQGYRYAGPRSKRLTAEQFMDCVWQITDTSPVYIDAPFVRGRTDPTKVAASLPKASWIWTEADAMSIPVDRSVAFRKEWHLDTVPGPVVAVVSCDNAFTLYINGELAGKGDDWLTPQLLLLPNLKNGKNEILVVAKNTGKDPGPAGIFFEARWTNIDREPASLVSDESWQWSEKLPNDRGKYKKPVVDWQPAARVQKQNTWMPRVESKIALLFSRSSSVAGKMTRASLMKSDFLTRSLGRPNRDQIVSVRPLELTTLEAIDLSNGETLATILNRGAENLLKRKWRSTDDLVQWLFHFSLCREPKVQELKTLNEIVGSELTVTAVEDVLWAIVMLPEFQVVR
jgi:Protein of unknown function (DUF1549)/Protein of unknown function (DUF1553)/Planctomycete cytochrome C